MDIKEIGQRNNIVDVLVKVLQIVAIVGYHPDFKAVLAEALAQAEELGYDRGYNEGFEDAAEYGAEEVEQEGYRNGYVDGVHDARQCPELADASLRTWEAEDKRDDYDAFEQDDSFMPISGVAVEPVPMDVTVNLPAPEAK